VKMSLLRRLRLSLKNGEGVVSVEYAFTMLIAALIMVGVQALFERVSVNVIGQFIRWIKTFP